MSDHEHHHSHDHHNVEVINTMGSPREYAKFTILIAAIFTTSLLLSNGLEEWMRIFMGIYLLVFGLFKLADLKMFAHGFSEYDPLAMRYGVYAKVYPFIELALSVLFLANIGFPWRNYLVIIIFSINLVGVLQHLHDKNKIRCACLGKFVNLPLTTITVTEDALMVVMGAVGLLI